MTSTYVFLIYVKVAVVIGGDMLRKSIVYDKNTPVIENLKDRRCEFPNDYMI